ncbi:hypothetical protein KOW79_022723 [Hemibagrus wyckioides]|uniref:Uncharacterized protein n=1 Tax=Hemibagrus wyckioides TaxID=337641 RepID=A0A9D3S876_9TELE|nr:uncharacterized protein si:dkey-22i16.7 [Hemibagrus wyckioides]KAG7314227.1 hypothetical protein KOW79_022723 [Hemibagrus wyckioides]
MKIVLVFVAVSFIALSCAVPVEEEHEREKRSSSGEQFRGFFPSSYPTSNNDWMNILMPLLIARFLAPAPAPAPAPAAAAGTGK